MRDLTIFTLILLILAALLCGATESEVTLKIATLLWIILAASLISAIWTILLLANLIGDGIKKLKE